MPARLLWQDKLLRKAKQAFFFDADRLAVYASPPGLHSTGEEEMAQLGTLVRAARQDAEHLARVGFGPDDIAVGEALLNAVEDLVSTHEIRDQLLALSVQLCRYAYASGVSAFWDSPLHARIFERTCFERASRRGGRRLRLVAQ